MTPLQALLLGIVQGLTEFLPVSSSGHLVLGKKLLGVASELPVTFEVVMHAGTLLATLIVFWKPVWEILDFLRRAATGRVKGRWWDDPSCRLLVLVIVGTIPAGVLGVLFNDFLESLFSSTLLVGIALCFTGTLLILTRWIRPANPDATQISVAQGVAVGIAQAVAITPGISRSGSTIATGLLCGMDREMAARFSFLLSMPAIAGAIALKARDIEAAGAALGWQPLAVGFAAALVVGVVALLVLLGFVRRGRLHWFGYYCWAVGLAAMAALFLGYLPA